MEANYRTICERFPDERSAVRFLQEKGILHRERLCARGHPMKLSGEADGAAPRWRCHKSGCRTELSLRTGTWLQGHKLGFRTTILLLYSWSRGRTTAKYCHEELGITAVKFADVNNFIGKFAGLSSKCAVAWKRGMREVVAESLARDPLVIGGPGLTVEVDESVLSKKKSGRGREYPRQWIFGGVCRETGECFIVPVGDRSSQTLMPLIRQYIRPGTTVITDCWRGYRGLARAGFTHLTVNHSRHFVQPVTGAHTQTVESLWAQVKRANKLRCGTHRSSLDSYLKEFMWRRRLRPQDDPFDKIVGEIATYWAPE